VYDIETKEDCSISGRAPPFIKIKMHCGHWLSLMAFSGVIGIRSSAYTESIFCPMCREALMPELITKTPPEIVIPPMPKVASNKPALKLEDYKKSKILMSAENKSDVSETYLGRTYNDSDLPPSVMTDAYGANPLIIGQPRSRQRNRSRRHALANLTPEPIDTSVSDVESSEPPAWDASTIPAEWLSEHNQSAAEAGWDTE
jgi:hypothetical protein